MKFALQCLLALPLLTQAQTLPADEYFRTKTVAKDFVDPMEIAVTPKGYVFVIERTGAIKLVNPTSGKTLLIDTLEVAVRDKSYARESGLLGIALDPDYANNKWIYLYYSPKDGKGHRLSRFTFDGKKLTTEKTLLEIPTDRDENTCHEGGSLAFGPNGNLFLSTGDNTCPFKSDGYAPIDEREDRHQYDAQRTAGNTNDLRGKILRITPTPNGSYTIPEGNLFAKGTSKTRPEIYVMGCRNPYRISIDSKNSDLYWGKVGPDAGRDSDRGPRGYDEINQAREAGNYGWPYFSANNKPYRDFNFDKKKTGELFDPEKPINNSPNNTGLTELPPAQSAFQFYPRASACAGPVFYSDEYENNTNGLPNDFDNCLITFDWTTSSIGAFKLDQDRQIEWQSSFLAKFEFAHPNDMAMGPEGQLYILEYGSGWYDNTDGKLTVVTYSKEKQEIKVSNSDPRMAGLPLAHPGSKLIASSTCLACHNGNKKSIGPSYVDIAKKYVKDKEASYSEITDTLANKILTGGVGVWGEQPMPPHPQLNIEQTQQMVDAILDSKPPKKGKKKKK